MPLDSVQLSVVLSASPEQVFHAWLDPRQHAAFTGSPADVDPVVGGKHSAWDGYITGKNLVLDPGRKIVQSWRTTEFPPEAGDSRLELALEPVDGGTALTLSHTELPEGQGASYEQGWVEYYFEPMKKHFAAFARLQPVAVPPPPAPARKAAAKKPAKKTKPAKKAAPKKSAKAARRPAKKAKPARKVTRAKARPAKKPPKKARGKKR